MKEYCEGQQDLHSSSARRAREEVVSWKRLTKRRRILKRRWRFVKGQDIIYQGHGGSIIALEQ